MSSGINVLNDSVSSRTFNKDKNSLEEFSVRSAAINLGQRCFGFLLGSSLRAGRLPDIPSLVFFDLFELVLFEQGWYFRTVYLRL